MKHLMFLFLSIGIVLLTVCLSFMSVPNIPLVLLVLAIGSSVALIVSGLDNKDYRTRLIIRFLHLVSFPINKNKDENNVFVVIRKKGLSNLSGIAEEQTVMKKYKLTETTKIVR